MNNFCGFLSTLFLGCTVVLWSCKDNDVAPANNGHNEGPPDLHISRPINGAALRGTTTIEADAVLAGATLDNVTMFVDDVQVKVFKEAHVSFDWNSETVENGTHVIKLVATTVSGKTAQASVTVSLDNTPILADFLMPDDYSWFRGSNNMWFFASDDQGNLIDIAPVNLASHVTLFRKNGFKGDSFTLTAVTYFTNGDRRLSFYTVPGFKAGNYTLPGTVETRTPIGQASITFTGLPEDGLGFRFFAPTSSLGPDTYVPGELTFKGDLYSNPTAYLFSRNADDGQPLYMTGKIAPGDKATRSATLQDMSYFDTQYVSLPKGQISYITMSGYHDDGFYYSYYSNHEAIPDSRLSAMHIPTLFFDSYAVELRAQEGKYTYYQGIGKTNTLPTTMEYINCSIVGLTNTGNTYKMNVEGDCDYVNSRSFGQVGTLFEDWNMWAAPNVQYVMPKIPELVTSTVGASIDFKDLNILSMIYAFDYEDMNGYEGFLKTPYGYMGLVSGPPGIANMKYLNYWSGD